jgi:hypothetical protein
MLVPPQPKQMRERLPANILAGWQPFTQQFKKANNRSENRNKG